MEVIEYENIIQVVNVHQNYYFMAHTGTIPGGIMPGGIIPGGGGGGGGGCSCCPPFIKLLLDIMGAIPGGGSMPYNIICR